MQSLVLLGLLGTALAHPGHASHKSKSAWKPTKRTVDLNQFRLETNSSYASASVAAADPAVKRLGKRGTIVETATALVQSVFPDAEFRIADSYVGTNGVGHVYFKQTVFGLDIDNSDFNVNVSPTLKCIKKSPN